MTAGRTKLKVCVHVHGSSPAPHEARQHDWRPSSCRKMNCHGFLENCETGMVRKFKTKEDIRKMIAYLRRLKVD